MLNSVEITAFQDKCLTNAGWPETLAGMLDGLTDPAWQWIATNHRYNSLLWAEEDLARRRDVSDSEIAKNKRAIDGFNQARNDATECIDEALLVAIGAVQRTPTARQHSETAGMMIDRLSIMSLKTKAMREQVERTDASEEHRESCRVKLARLNEQRADLAACLDSLLADAVAGDAYFKIYRQFKMYNDPTLNPQLYASKA